GRSLWFRLGLAGGQGWRAGNYEHPQSRQSVDGRPYARVGLGRLGARLLPELPKPPAGLHRRVVERGQLEKSGRLIRRGEISFFQFQRIKKSHEVGLFLDSK